MRHFFGILFSLIINYSNAQKLNSKMVEKCMKSVVNIESFDSYGVIGQGTGFYISANRIVTNYHVIEGAQKIRFQFKDDNAYYYIDDNILLDTLNNDIAILQTTKKAVPLNFALAPLSIGEQVFTIGNPAGTNPFSLSNVSSIANLNREIFLPTGRINCIQLNNNINPGNSGGPILNLRGEVIGICVAGIRGFNEISYAIPKEKFFNTDKYSKALFSKLPKFNRFISLNTLKEDNTVLSYFITRNGQQVCGDLHFNIEKYKANNCFLELNDTLGITICLHNTGTVPIENSILNIEMDSSKSLSIKLQISGTNFRDAYQIPLLLAESLPIQKMKLIKMDRVRLWIQGNYQDEKIPEEGTMNIFNDGFKKGQIFPERNINGLFWDNSNNFSTEQLYYFYFIVKSK